MRKGTGIKVIGIIAAIIGFIVGLFMLTGVTGLVAGIVQGQGLILMVISVFFGIGLVALGELIEQLARVREIVDKPEELHNGTWS